MTNLIGQSLGRYHILEQLGEGGMAIVYKAYDTCLEADVAVKVIRTENLAPSVLERSLKRFEREAKALAKLTHPNIVKVMDYGEYEGMPYLVMEYLPGGTLKHKLGKPMAWREAVQLILPVAEALDYAHSQNLIHRDVKPSNILLTERGQPMLTDFGIAKILDLEETQDLTGTSAAVGTPEYMAPEQATAKTVDHRVDIYASGIVLYEMLTGRKPFTADTPMAILIKHTTEPLPRPRQFAPHLPDEMEKILIKALAKQPEDRYQSFREMTKAMAAFYEKREQPTRMEFPAKQKVDTNEPIPKAPTRLHFTPTRALLFGMAGIFILAVFFFSRIWADPPATDKTSVTSILSTQISAPTQLHEQNSLSTETIPPPVSTMHVESNKITFLASEESGKKVYIYDLLSEELSTLNDQPLSIINYSWPPVNGQFVYTTRPGSDWGDIVIFNLNTGAQTKLTDNVGQYDSPTLSSNGEDILLEAYTGTFRGLNDGTTSLKLLGTGGGNMQQLLFFNTYESLHCFFWSGDNQRILYWRAEDIWVINRDGSEIVNLTKNGGVQHCAQFSPIAHNQIAVIMRPRPGEPRDIFLINIADSSSQQLTSGIIPIGSSNGDLSWSPNGKHISLVIDNRLTIVDVFTGEFKSLITPFISASTNQISWFPDGKSLAFISNGNIYTIAIDGSNLKQNTKDSIVRTAISWIQP